MMHLTWVDCRYFFTVGVSRFEKFMMFSVGFLLGLRREGNKVIEST